MPNHELSITLGETGLWPSATVHQTIRDDEGNATVTLRLTDMTTEDLARIRDAISAYIIKGANQ